MPAYSFKRGDLTIEVWPASVYDSGKWVALPDYYDGAPDAHPSAQISATGNTPEDAADELEWAIRQYEEDEAMCLAYAEGAA